MKVSIIGASGFAGGEILRIVAAHPVFEVDQLCASSSVGKKLGEFHPQLRQLAQRELKVVDPVALKENAAIFLALPHGQSGKIAAQLRAAGVESLVVDCGADHRLTSKAAWDSYYGGEYCPAWTYGMPELQGFSGPSQREQLKKTKQIAVPGCNVTAVTLAFQPLVAAGLIDPGDIVATLAVGYSGAGKSLKPHLLATSGLGNAQPYAVGGTHRHIPEIAQNFAVSSGKNAEEYKITLTPVLVPMSRGILATVTAGATQKTSTEQLHALYQDYYQEENLIQVLERGSWPQTQAVTGSANVQVQVTLDQRSGKIIALSALDNLGKGTAQAAVQSANLALGLPEYSGINQIGVAP
ncbi:N-acetyl-gamma-glutamyl-phosphate reductase [Varibaculum cambriense]|uniref:N-acetyl-gamma-glutamyl-phosphate reductase n=1 Tax=Varibaculum cambriense TaxID=184870 RepID=UPI0029154B94|nr:N-acetyl-gamma-glutamyl-phosphate reductase [Varibaculum cambriense]MDU3274653.1 N-acetyl-gamma-glutamyl-phosphate reductase [Varibaculum cambriense]